MNKKKKKKKKKNSNDIRVLIAFLNVKQPYLSHTLKCFFILSSKTTPVLKGEEKNYHSLVIFIANMNNEM